MTLFRFSTFLFAIFVAFLVYSQSTWEALNAYDLELSHTQEFPLFEELNYISHPVTTSSPQAQKYFNQGLTFIYAFNYDAAYRSFLQAVKLDENMAMGYWGLALASGPIFSTQLEPAQEKEAYALIQKALKLSAHITDYEKKYIEALAQRYTSDAHPDFIQLAQRYSEAMKKISEAYPDDLDAKVLYIESYLDINVDKLWKDNGEPNSGTEKLLQVFEYVLRSDPENLAANHFYIHTMESSKHFERALESADRLSKVSPILSHLVHSASHIYIKAGFYQACIRVNEIAVPASKAYYKRYGGNRPLNSYTHNLFYLTRSFTMAGFYPDAINNADQLRKAYVDSGAPDNEMEFQFSIPLFVLIHFQAWKQILDQPHHPKHLPLSEAYLHFARSVAFASLGAHEEAQNEQALFKKLMASQEKKLLKEILAFLSDFLEAKMALMRGDPLDAIHWFKAAVAKEDALDEDAFFEWLLISRENLGEALLQNQQYDAAERVFRKDLEFHIGNGRSLSGLLKSLEFQGKSVDAFWINKALERALHGRD